MSSADLISRQDIEWHDYHVADGNGMYHNDQIAYKSQVDDLPSAQPERKRGEWIPGKEISREMCAGQVLHIEYENFRCSACGVAFDRILYHVDGGLFYKFCPNCGADMRGEQDE